MNKLKILAMMSIVGLLIVACNAVSNLPQIASGTEIPVKTEAIHIPVPSQTPVDLSILFGAGNLTIAPGATDALVSGNAQYNIADLQPAVQQNGANVKLSTGELTTAHIPNFGTNLKNDWDLQLGNAPMNLTLNAGAYHGSVDLGGLSLLSLHVMQGAAETTFNFSSANTSEMSDLNFQTGASNTKLENLSNANFSNMLFRGGAGNYTLDFGGQLQRDAQVRIDAGLGTVNLVVPRNTAARLSFQGGLSSVNSSGGWQKSGSDYVLGSGSPQITFTVEMGAGNLDLSTK